MFCGITGFGVIMFFPLYFSLLRFLGVSRQHSSKALQRLERRESAQGFAWECGSVRPGVVQAQQDAV